MIRAGTAIALVAGTGALLLAVAGRTASVPKLAFVDVTKEAGLAKKSEDPAQGQKLLDAVDEVAKVFWETKS